MTALPFPLHSVSSGLTALSPAARQVGRDAAAGAGRALRRFLDDPVTIEARPLPAACPLPAGWVRLPLGLDALPAVAWLEFEAALACRLMDRLAGGDGDLPPALELTPLERAGAEVLTLIALDGAAEVAEVAALGPRLLAADAPVEEPLGVELSLAVGALRGRGRLHLPARALRPLAGPATPPPFAERWTLTGLVLEGSAALAPGELDGLAPGDVVVLDTPRQARITVAFPGFALLGREQEGHLVVEELMERPAVSLPVTLTVEVARITLSLGELWRLEPGSALALPAPRDGRVVLRLEDRPVARGQLVDVDGALGVRIESVEDRP